LAARRRSGLGGDEATDDCGLAARRQPGIGGEEATGAAAIRGRGGIQTQGRGDSGGQE
jgi:hypothetical protein